MSDYISRDAVAAYIRSYASSTDVAFHMEKHLNEIPAADVRPVVRGRWMLKTFDDGFGEYQLYECDKCGAVTAQRRNFCYNCGAKMEAEGGE